MSYLRQLNKICTSLNLQYSVRLHAQLLKEEISRQNINKVLIANRGEIACRVIRTARKLGIRSVAVYSDADKHAMHVEMADEAYHIGPAASSQSYLNASKILEVAKKSNSQAIHPGYGFLSENVEFCEKCANEGVIFIGPPPKAIRDMGIKSTSKAIMSNAGVPVVRGYHGEDQSIERLQAEAQKVGFPLMIKAVRGGGGKGMRIAMTETDFLPQLESAKRESMKSFGDDNMLLEQYITDPRHVEVQVFADMHGNVVHLFERDCSVQRRHQKIIEEAPAPGISEETRRAIGEAAVRAARAVGYVGAGTVEFILHRVTHEFHFMEMNTRLQVEHPITEMITGTDLVEWQLRVAAGEPLPVTQQDIVRRGHAVECRIYAEEPGAGFLPRAGTLHRLRQPTPEDHVRIETGVREGQEVSVHYDPMIAKLVVWGKDRHEALAKTRAKLSEYQVAGLETNVNFLLRLSGASAFVSGDVHTAFIPQHEAELFPPTDPAAVEQRVIQAALGYVLNSQKNNSANDCWKGISVEAAAWRPNYQLRKTIALKYDENDLKVTIEYGSQPNTYNIQVNDGEWRRVEATIRDTKQGLRLSTLIGDRSGEVGFLTHDDEIHVYDENGQTVVRVPRPKHQSLSSPAAAAADTAASPTPGVMERLLVQTGDKVVKGQPLFMVIAMKMEYVVRSPRDGVVAEVAAVKQGDSVGKGAVIVRLQTDS
ncbi:methylcrotonoyl-CoA carboxylase subunit alpha, mitochondrial [Plodia interpunctella]|uniref:methylcrotonoyl-CoA carboxylase subunit alpha, mitochondrial n=1 Tax=Plodia interpunctella TaxID=58824 RepID=UPI002367FF21|nr:methylcrotonoyl-CoA carboxylase subunit alpha, mitochondrial [Plodia interpunctella]